MAFIVNSNTVNKAIPDNSDSGLESSIKIFNGGTVTSLEVNVNIEHPYSGDLEIQLTAPSGKKAVLHSRSGSSKANINKVFDSEATAEFIGEKAKGDWVLTVKDFAPRDAGILQSWSLRLQNEDKKEDSEIFIPDGAGKKLVSKQVCEAAGKIKKISASVDIEHAYIGDLEVTLVGPGVSVKLHDREGGNKKNLKKTYSNKALADFIGTKAKGTWSLEIADHAPRDSGRIHSWNLDITV